MRRLVIHRERALACFAMKYHCIVGRERERFLEELSKQGPGVHLWDGDEPTLQNGQTIGIVIGEEPVSFFVVACLDGWDLATEEVTIPAGEGDVYFTVRTDFDGDKRLSLQLIPAEP